MTEEELNYRKSRIRPAFELPTIEDTRQAGYQLPLEDYLFVRWLARQIERGQL